MYGIFTAKWARAHVACYCYLGKYMAVYGRFEGKYIHIIGLGDL